MTVKISVDMYEYWKQNDAWKKAEEEIEPEIKVKEPFGNLEVLNRYIENYKKLSLLVENYVKLLEEDRTRIFSAVTALMDVDGNLLRQ